MDYAAVADLYDNYVTADIDIPFFLEEARKTAGPVLELTAGTGRVSLPLIEAGVDLTCVDISPEMLDVLRAKLDARGLTADLHAVDMCDLALGKRFDLIFIPFHAFAEVLDADDQRRALDAVSAHLSAEGRFICTLHNPPVRLRRVDGQLRLWHTFPVKDGRGFLFGTETYYPESHLVQGYEFFEEYDASGLMRARRVLDLQFHVLEYDRFKVLIEAAGFERTALYGDYARAPFDEATSPFMIWELRRPAR